MIWYSGQTALFLILLARAAPKYLPTALSVAPKPLFPFQQAQYAQVFLLRPAPFCTLFAGLGSTNKSATSLLVYLTLVLSSPSSFLLPQTLWQIWQELSSLSSCLSGYNGSPDTRFSLGTTQLMSWPDREHYLWHLQSIVVSLLLSLVSTLVFSRTGRRTISSKFFDTLVSSISTKELVFLGHAHCVLSRLCCNEHSLLFSSYLSMIGRIHNSSCSTCRHSSQDTSHLILHCPATDSLHRSLFGDSLSFYDLWSRPWEVARLLGLHGLRPCPYPSEGSGN